MSYFNGFSGYIYQSYTQYIPLSVYDLQTWMGSPSIYVYDCSNAGIIIELFRQFSQQRENELEVNMKKEKQAQTVFDDDILKGVDDS